MKTYDIAVIGGDGTGPEVTREALKVCEAAARKFKFKLNWHPYDFGGDRYLKTGEALPDFVDELNWLASAVAWQPEDRVGPSDALLLSPAPEVKHIECEYAVPFEHTAEALRTTRRLIDRNEYRANLPVEVRFVAGDENMLSPTYGRDASFCYIGAYTSADEFAQRYFEGFEPAMKALGGRPHWGKCFNLTGAEARERYEMFDAFDKIRRRLDPDGVFANQLIRDLFE